MQPFLAFVVPVGGGGEPTHPIAPGGGGPSHPIAPGGPPPSIWNPVFPTNPIAPGGPPVGIWNPTFPTNPIAPGGGGGGTPGIDNTLPGQQPGVSHPIAPGGFVLIWHPVYGWILVKPGDLPPSGGQPDQGLPGDQPKPDQSLPPQQPKPDQGLPPPPTAAPKK